MLKISNLKVSFQEKKVLSNVSFSVEKGEVFGILGKNGAGKTTFFNAIYGNIKYEGNIFMESEKVKPNEISFLETSNYFYPYMKASEYFKLFDPINNNVVDLAKIFEIPLDEYIHNFSTGMKKKAAIIANTSLDKPILIMDEPFNGLDMESVENLYLLIEKLKNQGTIILISSHILETLIKCCSNIGYLEKGKIDRIYGKDDFKDIEITIRKSIKDNWDRITHSNNVQEQ